MLCVWRPVFANLVVLEPRDVVHVPGRYLFFVFVFFVRFFYSQNVASEPATYHTILASGESQGADRNPGLRQQPIG